MSDAAAKTDSRSEAPLVHSTAMEGAENYYRWQMLAIGSHLTERVIELGCGVGETTRQLLGRERVVSVDIDPAIIEYVHDRIGIFTIWAASHQQ